MSAKTEGEALFEQYLTSQRLPFEFEKDIPGTKKHPDYAVSFEEQELLFEVKDIVQPPPPQGFSTFFDSYDPIRSEIGEARKKLRGMKTYVCGLVLHVVSGFVMLDDPLTVFGAMYGDVQIRIPFDPEKGAALPGEEMLAFGPGGKMMSPRLLTPRNTTISAIIAIHPVPLGRVRLAHEHLSQFPGDTALEHFENEVGYDSQEIGIGVITYENKDARRPLPTGIFRGPYDQRWASTREGFERVFAGERIQLFNKLRGKE